MQEMSAEEIRGFLAHNTFGILGLARAGKAYALPLFYGTDGKHIYFHTVGGAKVPYIKATDEACFTVARVMGLDDWASVMAFGPVRPIDETERDPAMDALLSVPLPPRWGFSETGEPARGDEAMVIFVMTPTRATGRSSTRPEMTPREREIAFGGM